MNIQKILTERQKSANERELEKRLNKKREYRIKMELDKLRKQESKELWKGKNSVLKSDCNIMKNDRPILKEKNIFKNKRSMFM